MGSNISCSARTTHVLIGDLSSLSPVEQKLFRLSVYVLDKNPEMTGKVSARLGVKIIDFKTDEFILSSDDNKDAISDTDLSSADVKLAEVRQNINSLFYILVTDKPFYYSQTFSMWRTFYGYENLFSCCRPVKHTIYIQPVNNFPSFIADYEIKLNNFRDHLNFFTLLQTFAEAFFGGMKTRILPNVNIVDSKWNIKTRVHKVTGQKQFYVKDLYKALNTVTPPDGYCIMGISWTDLYPSEDLNFVLGEANPTTKSGIFCFGRFEPKTFNAETHKDIKVFDGNLMWRILKVFSHELCHLFGLQHCWYFHCSMNESKSMAEASSQPLFLCPVCLRKLQYACDFDILVRYKRLLRFLTDFSTLYPTLEFKQSVYWLEKCIEFLETDNLH